MAGDSARLTHPLFVARFRLKPDSLISAKTLEANPAVLHLASVAFETNRSRLWDGHVIGQKFAIAGCMSDAAFDRDDQLVPATGFVILQFCVRTSQQEIATL